MTHAEFVDAWRGARVQVDPQGAAQLLSARLMLPFVLLPVLGAAVALALVGHYFYGGALFAAALALRYAVRRSAGGYVLQRALADERFYAEALAAGLITAIPGSPVLPRGGAARRR